MPSLETPVLGRQIENRWFLLAELLGVAALTLVCMLQPGVERWIILLALVPLALRVLVKQRPFKQTRFDWLVLFFAVTAWVGYLAAYDRAAAWDKAWWVTAAVLLYYALAAQPRENLPLVGSLLFCVGVGAALHFFLAYDFAAAPRKLELVNRVGRWLMEARPVTGWMPIHPNYTAGLGVLSAPFAFLHLRNFRRGRGVLALLVGALAAAVLGVILLALVMTTSRGAFLAAAAGLGVWLLWKLVRSGPEAGHERPVSLFPVLVIAYLAVLTLLLYWGPASQGSIAENYHFGNGSRAELFTRSLYLLEDYAFTGGGLGSFPGLYSRYLLNIPYYNVPNSHNLFLDVGIEQGFLGGLAFLVIQLVAIWRLAALAGHQSEEGDILPWLILFALAAMFIHGMVDDYLYNGRGTFLSLALAGFAAAVLPEPGAAERKTPQVDRRAAGIVLLVLAALLILRPGVFLSTWYANQGAVQMARVELDGFPNVGWSGREITARMTSAEASMLASLQADPSNRTANQRLGMLAMLRQDFAPAEEYLTAARLADPGHRGVLKSLGFCRVWLGDIAGAKALLENIPEAQEELDAYIWWWGQQDRPDLALNAELALMELKDSALEP